MTCFASDTTNRRTSGDEGWLLRCLACLWAKRWKHEKTKANGQLACMLCTCTRGNNSSYQQVAVVCVWRPRTADIVTRHCLATIFTPLSFTTLTVAVASFQMADSTCLNGWKATNMGQLAPRVWDKTRAAEAHRHLRPGVTGPIYAKVTDS